MSTQQKLDEIQKQIDLSNKARYMEQIKANVKPHPLYGGCPIKIEANLTDDLLPAEDDTAPELCDPNSEQYLKVVRSSYRPSVLTYNIHRAAEIKAYTAMRERRTGRRGPAGASESQVSALDKEFKK